MLSKTKPSLPDWTLTVELNVYGDYDPDTILSEQEAARFLKIKPNNLSMKRGEYRRRNEEFPIPHKIKGVRTAMYRLGDLIEFLQTRSTFKFNWEMN